MLYARFHKGFAMSSFVMRLCDATDRQTIEDVTLFVGMDATGSFGIQANHGRFMTTRVFGLARFRRH
jgi:F-type H+-transporting ATPase subunit epsilon